MFSFLGENIGPIVELITGLVGCFAILATMTANESDNMLADKALKLINMLGANIGNARNE